MSIHRRKYMDQISFEDSSLIPIRHIAKEMGIDKGTLTSFTRNTDITIYHCRTARSKHQQSYHIKEENKEKLISLYVNRSSNNFINGDSKDENGYFYVMLPDLEKREKRVKMGWSIDVDQRKRDYLTIVPEVIVKKSWPCKKIHERTIIRMAITSQCK